MEVNPEVAGSIKRRATLKEVAAELGVAASTVSNAYNRPDQLSGELRERVFETARRLGYAGPDPAARGLRLGRSGAVGVLYADRLSFAFADPVAVKFLEGVSMATEEAGLGMLLVPGSPRQARDPEAVMAAVVDGFVVYSMPERDPLVGAALERRLPMVMVDQRDQGEVPSVGIEDREAARSAAEHLVQLGHESFGVVSLELALDVQSGLADTSRQDSATYRTGKDRLRGYRSCLADAGIPWDAVPVYECVENLPEEGRRAGEALLSQTPRPTAILAMSDQLALGVLEAAAGRGLRIPEDLSIVGFDDIPAAASSEPPLTTVHQPHVEKGLQAGRMLIAQLDGRDIDESGLLPTELVVRGSTAPAQELAGH
ncbi:MAG: LacI family DNA-binding transcriptional regulator [Rubrobacteraceae bacterium]